MVLQDYYHLAGVGLFGVAGWALLVTHNQLTELADANQQRLFNSRARFLFELDGRWEGQHMAKARIQFDILYDELHKRVCEDHPTVNDDKLFEHLQRKFSGRLEEFRGTDKEKYQQLLQIIGFFETAGMLVAKKYISAEDILDLYAGSILKANRAFRGHIQELITEKGIVEGLYEHALELGDLAIEWERQRRNKEADENKIKGMDPNDTIPLD